MATAASFASVPFLPPASAQSETRQAISTAHFPGRRRHHFVTLAVDSSSSESPPAATETPEIELEFIGPKPVRDGSYPVDKVKVKSGEKVLRNIMLENKLELYGAYGKVMNCGGGGTCGTCIVEVVDGKDLLNERTNTEMKYLKKAHLSIPLPFGSFFVHKLEDYLPCAYINFGSKVQKPESWRLACQTIVGNKENAGKVLIPDYNSIHSFDAR